jgi:hypothetical protein
LQLNAFSGLEHATIRDNIIFGSSLGFDEARYYSVIDACALEQDLHVFDAGDMTGMHLFPYFFTDTYLGQKSVKRVSHYPAGSELESL